MLLFLRPPILILLAAGVLAGCGGELERRVTVLVAASATDVVTEFAKNYEKKTGVSVVVATGPSNGLARQIMAGAPADVFVSASPEWAETLVKKDLVDDQTRLLINGLVLIVPNGNPRDVNRLSDLLEERVKRVALAGENVPAGQYAEAALRHHKFHESLVSAGKIVRGHDVRVTLGFVERGEVDAGIVYQTDAMASDDVRVVQKISPLSHPRIQYPAILLKDASPEGRTFYKALISRSNGHLFAKHGFTVGLPEVAP